MGIVASDRQSREARRGEIVGPTPERQSDEHLLARLRGGEQAAYTQLWQRHIAAALRVARSYAPGSAEDLASEAFLAVYRQVAVEGKGPERAFRPYLVTTMRNLAIRWSRAGKLVNADADIDQIDASDPLSILSDEAEASELLEAFTELPERWQRVLWLAEVEQVPRADIAAEFAIAPNAVSALAKRARAGLRVQWLTKQISPELLADPGHPAEHIPAYITEKRKLNTAARHELEAHLAMCAGCEKLRERLCAFNRRTRDTTLGVVGFAALGGVVPGSTAVTGAGTAALLFGGVAAGTTVGAGIGALAFGGALTAVLLLAGVPQGAPSPAQHSATAAPSPADADTSTGVATDESHTTQTEPGTGTESPGTTSGEHGSSGTTTGRGISDPTIPETTFVDPETLSLQPSPPEPKPVGPHDPTTAPEPGSPASGGTTIPGPGATPINNSAPHYFAPDITGTTAAGNHVHIGIGGSEYEVSVAADGSWAFSPSLIESLQVEGPVDYEVWSVHDGVRSPSQFGSFTMHSPQVVGMTGGEEIPLTEAATTGFVLRITGPPSGQVFLAHLGSGDAAIIQLGADGTATQRLRMFQTGTQLFMFGAIHATDEGMTVGPRALRTPVVTAADSTFNPWAAGGVSEGTAFELSDP